MSRKNVIIIGAGTSGIVAAKNLAHKYNVLLFEQSKIKKLPIWNRIPLMIGHLFKAENKYISIPKFVVNSQRKAPYFKSNVLGGCSTTNGSVHVLGSNIVWQKILSKFDLTLADLSQSYNSLFSFENCKTKINLRYAQQGKLDILFGETLRKLNINSGSTNYMNEPTFGPIINTVNRVFRSSVMNLKIPRSVDLRLGSKVEEIIIKNGKAYGVIANGSEYNCDALILCGGVIGTNRIVYNLAKKNDIPELDSLETIADHTSLRINVLTKEKINSLNEVNSSFFSKMLLLFKHIFGFKTFMQGSGGTSALHIDIDGDGLIDTRINLLNFYESGRVSEKLLDDSEPGFSLSITMMNPISRGGISFTDNSEDINPRYLSDQEDQILLKKALAYSLQILESKPLSDLILSIQDEDKIKNNPEQYIEENLFSGYHLIGGCSNLIEKNFQMKSIKNIFISDASIFDKYPSSNIHSSVAIISDLASKNIVKKSLI